VAPDKKRIRVGVIFGGRSGEHEVSLVSATAVINALDKEKYDIVPIGITSEGRWLSSNQVLNLLKSRTGLEQEPERFLVPEPRRRALVSAHEESEPAIQLDVVFPLVHGTFGEDGTLQGLLELTNIPYVGSGVLASAIGMDKIVQKQLHKMAGLPVVKYVWFFSSECKACVKRVVAAVEGKLKYPMFVKPANTGSSVGVSKAHDRQELIAAMNAAVEYDRKLIIEQGVKNAREIECSVLGNEDPVASIPGEVIPSKEFYDYDAKYVDGKSRTVIPADLPKNVAKEIQCIAVRAFTVLDGAGMARVDFLMTKKKNKIYLNEINTIPGFTSISMYPKLWEASGLSYPELLDRLIGLAIERHRQRSLLKTAYQPTSEWYKS
jgi:D-alanine-D-alanine ligase